MDDHGGIGLEVVLVYSPDRLSRKYAYQVLVLEEFARYGVDVVFLQGPRAETPEDVLLLQFQGMIAEYEKAQISERTRRGKRHRAQAGSVNALTGAPFGYRYVRKAEGAPARHEVVESEAAVVREVFRRYTEEWNSLGAITRWLTMAGIRTRTGQSRWNKSSVWDMLRNPAYQGTACFQKTRQAERQRVNRRLRQRGGIPAHQVCSRPRPREEWIEIRVPALVSPTQFALAQQRFEQNRQFAARHTKQPSPLQGLLICQLCGYALYRYSTRTTRRRLTYYRCMGTDAYRFPQNRRCANRPVRQDAVEALVWEHVIQLLSNPALVRAEIDRRLVELRTDHVGDVQRDVATKELARIRAGITRLIEAYQEQLISLIEHIAHPPPEDRVIQRGQRVVRAAPRTEPVGTRQEVLLVNRRQYPRHRGLYDLVLDGGNPDRPKPGSLLWHVAPANRWCHILPGPQPLVQPLQVTPEILLSYSPAVTPSIPALLRFFSAFHAASSASTVNRCANDVNCSFRSPLAFSAIR